LPPAPVRGEALTVTTIPTRLARQQIDALRGRAKASLIAAVNDIRQMSRPYLSP
jgi:hypothetical protein